MRFFLLGLLAIVSVLMADALCMYDFPNFKSGESGQGLVAHRENLNNHAKKRISISVLNLKVINSLE